MFAKKIGSTIQNETSNPSLKDKIKNILAYNNCENRLYYIYHIYPSSGSGRKLMIFESCEENTNDECAISIEYIILDYIIP